MKPYCFVVVVFVCRTSDKMVAPDKLLGSQNNIIACFVTFESYVILH